MYTQFFGLTEKPFSITPDPRYLYMSRRHADALAHLIYGISQSGGFIQLTGEVGTGKTTLVRSLLEQLPEEADVALILNPELTTQEFLTTIAEELNVELPTDDLIILGALQRQQECVGFVEIFQRKLTPAQARPGFLQFVEQMCGYASRYLERKDSAESARTPAEFWKDFEDIF